MPLYEYKCPCGKTQEIQHRILERPTIKCKCGSTLIKQISASIIKFNCSMPTYQKENNNGTKN